MRIKIKRFAHGGKNKNKKLFFYFILPIILAVFFVFSKNILASDKEILINEVYATGNDDWIELYNTTDNDIDLANNYRIYKAVSSFPSLLMRFGNVLDGNYPGGTIIKSHRFYLIVRDDASSKLLEIADAICTKDTFTWDGSGYTIYFGSDAISSSNDPDIIDKVRFVDAQNNTAPEIQNGKSIGRLDGNNSNNNSQDFTLQNPTPNSENKALEKETKPKIYSDKIQINELLPSPNDENEEYIELYNGSSDKIDLNGWLLHDASKSGEYLFSASDFIDAKKYFVLYESIYKFALNNSGDESVTLFNPDKKEVFKVSYNGSKKGISYNFNGKDWHWSKFLTPGKKNVFEKIPVGELNIDKSVYVNVYANFEIAGLSKGAKVDWDFGDGHGSSLRKTRHKYTEIGKYNASVKYSEDSEDVTKNFTVDVDEVPHPEVKIISINPNPVGSDTDNETITLQNKSRKKVNLNGWSIATGWKKLINHPISVDFEIKANKEKEITHEFSKFTLNNKRDKIELRYPDGEVAYDVKYNKKKKSVAEGEVYVKGKKGWKWQASKKPESGINNQDEIQNQQATPDDQIENIEQKNTDDNTDNIPDEDVVINPKIERENKLAMNNKNIFKIELSGNSPRVLGAETVRETNDTYFFTPEHAQEEHFAVTFLKNIITMLNLKMNTLINNFLS